MMYFVGIVLWPLCCVSLCGFGRLIVVIFVVRNCGSVLLVYMGRFAG